MEGGQEGPIDTRGPYYPQEDRKDRLGITPTSSASWGDGHLATIRRRRRKVQVNCPEAADRVGPHRREGEVAGVVPHQERTWTRNGRQEEDRGRVDPREEEEDQWVIAASRGRTHNDRRGQEWTGYEERVDRVESSKTLGSGCQFEWTR